MSIIFTKFQQKVYDSTADYIGIFNNFPIGKTTATAFKTLKFLNDNPNTKGLYVYLSSSTLTSVLASVREWSNNPKNQANVMGNTISFTNGSILTLSELDEDTVKTIVTSITTYDVVCLDGVEHKYLRCAKSLSIVIGNDTLNHPEPEIVERTIISTPINEHIRNET